MLLLVWTYPVRNRLPTLASAKLNTLVGLFRFTISRFNVLKTERISSIFWLEMNAHRTWRASTMSSHSARAFIGSVDNLYSKSALIAVLSSSPLWLGMRRTRRPVPKGLLPSVLCDRLSDHLCRLEDHSLRTSPTPGSKSVTTS